MNLEPADLRKIAAGLAVLLLCLALGAGSVWWVLEQEKIGRRDANVSQSRFAEADRRLREVRLEEEEIRDKSTVFRGLAVRGIIGPERRLEWVETIAAIRQARRLFEVDYEFQPQQVLAGMTGPYPFNASQMQFRLPLLHEEDLLHFLADLRASAPALVQARHCSLQRVPAGSASSLSAQLTASCTLQWITIGDPNAGGSKP